MTQAPRIVYRARDDATPQTEMTVLGAVYAFVLNAKQRGRIPDKNDPDDATKTKENCANVSSLPH